MTTKAATGADAVAAALRAAEVSLAFGLPGVHNMALWPALEGAGIRIAGSRHEQGTVYAADGAARVTGRVGVAITTTGPGAANALGATGEAWASKSPVVVLSTDIPTTVRRPGTYRGFVHECRDQPGMFRPVTKDVVLPRASEQVGEAVTRAVEIALAPPQGPVYVELPADTLEGPAPAGARAPQPAPAPEVRPADWLERVLFMLRESRRPVLWAGGGARDAGRELDALARALGAPVVTTFQARGVLPDTHPNLVGLPPHEPAVSALLEEADLVLAVGSDLDQMMTQGWRLPLPDRRIAINIDPPDAIKNYAMDLVVEGNAQDVIGELAAVVDDRPGWAPDLGVLERETRSALSADPTTATAVEYLTSVERALPPETVVFADMAVCGYWLSGYQRVRRPRRLHYPMGWGTLGFAFPASIGAALVQPEPVVSFSGDGGILFAIGELALVAQERLPLTVVVVDDGGYGMLRYNRNGSRSDFGTELVSPDFEAIAHGFGLTCRTVDGVGAAFSKALAACVAAGEPSFLWARARLTPPRTTSPRWPLRDRPVFDEATS